jgi:hypothetical protein
MPTSMSRYAQRQSPNQQAKIASMMNATMGNKRAGPPPLSPIYGPPVQDFGGYGAFQGDERRPDIGPIGPPISQSLGRMASEERQAKERGTIGGGPDIRAVPDQPPSVESPDTRESASPEKGRRAKVVADTSPGRGTQYGREMSERPAPGFQYRVANRTIPGGGTYSGLWGPQPYGSPVLPQDTYLTLDGSEQYALQQNGYIDINGLRYAKNEYDEIVNIGPTPGRYGFDPFPYTPPSDRIIEANSYANRNW